MCQTPALPARDNWRVSEGVSEPGVRPIPRRGRAWIIALFALVLFGIGYLVVQVATQEPREDLVEVSGVNDAQRLFGGVPQEGDRLGSADAPVTVQVFNDLQCAACRDDFLSTIPALAEQYARPGEAKFLYRHYSNSQNPQQLGFFGAEAAAEQNYGWQYTYLFFRSQDEVGEFGVDQNFLESIASGIGELEVAEWRRDLETMGGSDGAIAERLQGDEELARELQIRLGQAVVVSGPNGTRTLQEGPSLAEIERAIGEVR